MTLIPSRLGCSLSVARFELGQLSHLLHIIDRGIRAELTGLEKEVAHAGSECAVGRPPDADDLMAVDDLGRYQNYVGVVMAFVIFERFLIDVSNTADTEIFRQIKDKERTLRHWGLYVEEFRDRLEIDLGVEPYTSIETFRKIRNKIARQGGQTLFERHEDGFRPGAEIPLSEQDVKLCQDLVEDCCCDIYRKYMIMVQPYLEETVRRQAAWDPFSQSDQPAITDVELGR